MLEMLQRARAGVVKSYESSIREFKAAKNQNQNQKPEPEEGPVANGDVWVFWVLCSRIQLEAPVGHQIVLLEGVYIYLTV